MSTNELEAFRNVYGLLESSLTANDVAGDCFTSGIMSFNELERVNASSERRNAVSILLLAVRRAIDIDPAKFDVFIEILRKEPKYELLVEQLRGKVQELTSVKQKVEKYKTFLRDTYKLLQAPEGQWPPVRFQEYIKLATVKKVEDFEDEDDCTKAMMNGDLSIVTDKKKTIQIEQIGRCEDGTLASCIIVEGIPGVGKSTLAWELGRRWGKGEILQDFHLVIVLHLRDERVKSADSICKLFFFDKDDQDIQQSVGKWVSTTQGENVLMILDGYDELSSDMQIGDSSIFAGIIKGRELPKLTVLVTSRPSANKNLYPLCRLRAKCQYIEVVGFGKEEIKKYIDGSLGDSSQRFQTYLRHHPHIHSLMYVPINCAIVVELFREYKKKPPQTLTEWYIALTTYLLERHEKKIQPQASGVATPKVTCFGCLSSATVSQLISVAKLAYQNTLRDQLIFDEDPELIETLGLLQKVPQLYFGRCSTASYNFLHKTLQEFLTAWHVSSQPSLEKRTFVQDALAKPNMAMIVRFMAGLAKFQPSPEDVGGFADIVISLETGDKKRLIETFHWMFETQNPAFIQRLIGTKELTLDCTHTHLNPFDLYVLGYCIAKSSTMWTVDLMYCSMADECMEMMFLVEEGKAFHHIKCLSLWGNSISDTNSSSLGKMLKENNTLKEFYLCKCGLKPAGLEKLIKGVQVNTKLETLYLSKNTFDFRTATCLGTMLKKNDTLKKLDLEECGLQPEGLEEVIKGVQVNAKLETLVLDSNTIDVKRASCLGTMLKQNSTLKELYLCGCGLQPEGLEEVIKGVQVNTKLETLNLSNNTIDNERASYLGTMLKKNNSLKKLDLDKCGLQPDGLEEVIKGVQVNTKLEALVLDNNNIDSKRASCLGMMLEGNKTLKRLDLQKCGLQPEGLEEVIKAIALKNNTTLKALNLSYNPFGEQEAKSLAEVMKNNETLERLEMYGCNKISHSGVQYLMDAMMSNTTLKMLTLPVKYKRLVPPELVGRVS